MGKREDFIATAAAGGSRQDFIDLANFYKRKSMQGVHNPFKELTIFDMLQSGALPSDFYAKGGIASLAPRSRYDAGNRVWPPEGTRSDGSFDPPQIPETLLQTMPMLTPELLQLMREYKKRQGLAKILEV